jgi:dolichol-phosphate mannosyltransferase
VQSPPDKRPVRKTQIQVVLPAFNEEGSVPPLLMRLNRSFLEHRFEGGVTVVNDGSTDRTAERVREFVGETPVSLHELPGNRGLAAAIMAGLDQVLPSCDPEDVVIIMDADNTHTPGLIQRMVDAIHEGADVAIASRFRAGSVVRGLSLPRRVLSWVGNIAFNVIVGAPGVRDYTCGYRAYRAGMLLAARERYGSELVTGKGFGCSAELLLKLLPWDPIIREVPLVLRYDFKESASKLNVPRTIRETLVLLARHNRIARSLRR